MKNLWPGEGFADLYEKLVLSFVQLFLMALIVLAVLDLAYLLWRGVTTNLLWTASLMDLQKGLQRGFAGALLVMIGLELLETTRAYMHDRRVRMEVIVVVAVIALGRHIIQLDAAHLDGPALVGIACIVVALMVGYYIIRRVNPQAVPVQGQEHADDNRRAGT